MTQAINLANFANNLDSAGQLAPTVLNAAVPVSKGGTGVTSDAAVKAYIGNLMYPVGTIYTNAGVNTNPATLFGFGTWDAFGAGRVMVGFDSANTLFDTLEETGGSADAVVVSHTHTATVTDPGHNHTVGNTVYNFGGSGAGFTGGSFVTSYTTTSQTKTTGVTVAVATTGSSATNANYQPYITVYMWKRTA